MKMIGKELFFTPRECLDMLYKKYDYKITLSTLRGKISNLNIDLRVGHINYIPEELLIYFTASLRTKEDRKKIRAEVKKLVEKYEKIIEEYEQEK